MARPGRRMKFASRRSTWPSRQQQPEVAAESNFDMYLAAILVLLASLAPVGRDAPRRVSGTDQAQGVAATEQDPQKPASDVPVKADTKPPETNSPDQPSAQKSEEAHPQTPPNNPPSAPTHKRRSRAKKPALTTDSEPRKIVIRHGGTSEPVAEIVPGITQEEANRQRESAEQLLTAAESSLTELSSRSLTPDQREMVVQIRQYMDVARSALKASDTQRAHTLAQKAYLLADDLVKHPE